MTKGRLVILGFGVAAFLMIALPIATVLTMTRAAPPEAGLDGDISKAFLATEGRATSTPELVGDVARLLPKGMREEVVFRKLAANGFLCATDANAATCYRSHEAAVSCQSDWTVRLIFSDNGTVWSTTAKRQATCS